jgi:hypothetical protein
MLNETIETLPTTDLTSVRGGFGISDLMQGSWNRQADAANQTSKDPAASTSAGAGQPQGTFTGGLRNLLSGVGG